MRLMTVGTIPCYGIDEEGDALFRLDCGHLMGYPVDHIHAAAKAGAGMGLKHSPCGCTMMIEPKDVVAISRWLSDLTARSER